MSPMLLALWQSLWLGWGTPLPPVGPGPAANPDTLPTAAAAVAAPAEAGHHTQALADSLMARHYAPFALGLDCTDDLTLFAHLPSWLGCPYRYAGSSRQGTDCSGFVQQLHRELYALPLPRTAQAQWAMCRPVEAHQLLPGDLLFFRFWGRGITHVGLYLKNGWFVHAAVRGGVRLDHLQAPTYARGLVHCGRLDPARLYSDSAGQVR